MPSVNISKILKNITIILNFFDDCKPILLNKASYEFNIQKI